MKKIMVLLTVFFVLLSINIIGKDVNCKPLTNKEKLEDFNYLYKIITENYPYLEVKKKQYGFDWIGNKKNFEKKILDTKNDAEFYHEIEKIIRLLQNEHTELLSPESYYEFVDYYNKYGRENSVKILNNKNPVKKYSYWNQIITDENKQLNNSGTYVLPFFVKYFQGEYRIFNDRSFSRDFIKEYSLEEGYKLKKVNGKIIDDYVKSLIDKQYLWYDQKRKKPYIKFLAFVENKRTDLNLEFENNTGEKTKRVIQLADLKYIESFRTEQPKRKKQENIQAYNFENEKTGYIKIMSFFPNSATYEKDNEKLYDYLVSVKDYKYLIIDIRNNSGGDDSSWQFVVSLLSYKDFYEPFYLVTRGGKYSQQFLGEVSPGRNFLKNIEKEGKNIFSKEIRRSFKYFDTNNVSVGSLGVVDFKGKIILLVNDGVFSASESFAAFVKKSKLAVLAGEPTNGDGIGMDPVFFSLPNSGLIIRFPIVAGVNPDGTLNEETKTMPDIYVESTFDDFIKTLENFDYVSKNIINPYDTILNYVIEKIIK